MKDEKVKVHYTKQALRDLFEIGEYIEIRLKNPKAARKVTAEIEHSISLLSEQPEMGRLLSSLLFYGSPYRFLVSGSYMVFYRFDNEVYVERILYGRRDYLHVLFS